MRALVVAALLALAVPVSAGSRTNTTGLRGHVTLCRATCAVSAKHVTLLFRYVFKISNATTDSSGNYHLSLAPGSYAVNSRSGTIRPAVVTVAAGRVKTVNFTLR
jgi:carboxypeptidase family protein